MKRLGNLLYWFRSIIYRLDASQPEVVPMLEGELKCNNKKVQRVCLMTTHALQDLKRQRSKPLFVWKVSVHIRTLSNVRKWYPRSWWAMWLGRCDDRGGKCPLGRRRTRQFLCIYRVQQPWNVHVSFGQLLSCLGQVEFDNFAIIS
jgi:hypothetical protein